MKFFSGTATYRKVFQASKDWFRPDTSLLLDLGRVGDLAEVTINGRDVGELWKAPWTIELGDALKPGENTLEIKVTNEWTNRIAGDRAGPPENRVLSGAAAGRGGAPAAGGRGGGGLRPSGLIGPVSVISKTSK